MTKIDIFSGFLGAGKTTLIKKLIGEAYKGEKVVLIENEFGEIGIDGGFLKDAGIEITEMNSGCICCSLVGDFSEALKKVLDKFSPDRIVIEPSGVGKLSDVIRAVSTVVSENVVINSYTAVVDAKKCKMYMKNFGEFYNDQVESAKCIVLSHTGGLAQDKIEGCISLIRNENEDAVIVSTPWDELDGKQILAAMEGAVTLKSEIDSLMSGGDTCPVCGGHHDHDKHEHHHHEHDEHCCDHDHDEHEHDEHEHDEHEHDEHEHDEHEHDEHEHEHHHDHDGHCCCGHDHEHDHGHHHADDVFVSWGAETTKKFTEDEIKNMLTELENERDYGIILRAKGIVAAEDGKWIHFDYVPGEPDVRRGAADVIGRLCVIGSNINKEAIEKLFSVEGKM